MVARKVVPMFIDPGGVMMFMHHKRLKLMGQCEEGEPNPLNQPARSSWRVGKARPAHV